MATRAQCAFCFECLSAAFDHRKPPSLAQVEELWEEYRTSPNGEGLAEYSEERGPDAEDESEVEKPIRPAAISRLLSPDGSSAGSSSSSLPSTNSSASSNQNSADNSSGNTTPASSNSSLRSKLSPFSTRRKGREADTTQQYPLFVKWVTVARSIRGVKSSKILRGCIGTFSPQTLETGLKSYALTSAFEDERFTPIPPTQLQRLEVQVTLLTDFSQPTSDPMAWTMGQHGLRIAFTHRGMRLGSTYLPDVAPEQGWNKEETVVSLMRKAGWSGSDWRKAWREGEGTLITYEGNATGLAYAEWQAWRDWVAMRNGDAKA